MQKNLLWGRIDNDGDNGCSQKRKSEEDAHQGVDIVWSIAGIAVLVCIAAAADVIVPLSGAEIGAAVAEPLFRDDGSVGGATRRQHCDKKKIR